MLKKVLSCLLVIAMTVTMAPLAFAADVDAPQTKTVTIDLDSAAEDAPAVTESVHVSELAGIDSLTAQISYAGMKPKTTESAILKVNWSFEAIDAEKPYSTEQHKTFNEGSGSVSSSMSVVIDGDEIMTGIYTVEVSTLTVEGKTGPSAKYELEVIPDNAVARVYSDSYDYDAYGELAYITIRNSYFTADGMTVSEAFNEAFKVAAEDCAEYYNVYLTMYEDLTDFSGFDPDTSAVDWLEVNANGHKIGSLYDGTNNREILGYLPVGGWTDFKNLSGLACFKLVERSDVWVYSVADDFIGIALSFEGNPMDYIGETISCVSMDDDTYEILPETRVIDASQVAVMSSGYTAVNSELGISIARTTDYPYALLSEDNTFDFFRSIRSAEGRLSESESGEYDGNIYVMNYTNRSNEALSRKSYAYPEAIEPATAAKLKTFIRVTDGAVSDFYVYKDGAWKFLYNNIGSEDAYNAYTPGSSENAVLRTLSGDASTQGEGGVNITVGWDDISGETFEWDAEDAGAYTIKKADEITIDVSGYASDAEYRKFTLVGCDTTPAEGSTFTADTKLTIIGNGSENVDFELIGEFNTVDITNACVYIGADEYSGDTLVEELRADADSEILAYNGRDYEDYKDFKPDHELRFGHIAINGYFDAYGMIAGGDPSKEVPQESASEIGNMCAIEIGESGEGWICESRIFLENSDPEYDVDLTAIRNNGNMLFLSGTDVSVSNKGGSACGVENSSVLYFYSNRIFGAGNTLTVENGNGVVSSGDNADMQIYELDCRLTGSSSEFCGVKTEGGVIRITGGEMFNNGYDADGKEKNQDSVYIDAGAGTAVYVSEDTRWSMQGANGTVRLKGANALVAKGDLNEPNWAPAGCLIATGVFDGNVSTVVNGKALTGKEAIEALLPWANYSVDKTEAGYRLTNHEIEFRRFLKSDVTAPEGSVYKLTCDIDLYDMFDDFFGYDDFDEQDTILVGAGRHIVDLNGFSVYSDTLEDDAIIDVPEGAFLQIYNTGADESTVRSVCTPAVVLVSGGEFINGDPDDAGKKAVSMCSQYDDGLAFLQASGKSTLYGGKYEGLVSDVFGEMNIYGGEYYGVQELYVDDATVSVGCLHIYGGTFHGIYDEFTPDVLPAITSSTFFADSRALIAADASDKSAVIPYGHSVHPYVNGAQAEDSEMVISRDEFTSMAAVNDEDTCIVVRRMYGIDVDAGDFFFDAVLWATENGITKGTDDTHFSPAAPVNRAQVVTFLWRAAGSPVVNYDMKLDDVKPGEFYTEAVRWALSEGITKGTSETTFSPELTCTRAEIITLLARYAGVEDAVTESGFSDVNSTDYFAAAVKWAKDNGVTEGATPTTFEPYEVCNRAQAITFLYRWTVK